MKAFPALLLGGLGGLAVGGAAAHFIPVPVDEKTTSGYTVRVVTAGWSLSREPRAGMTFSVEIKEPSPSGFAEQAFKPLQNAAGQELVFPTVSQAMAIGLEEVAVRISGDGAPGADGPNNLDDEPINTTFAG